MADSDATQTPLKTAAGAAGPQVVDALKLLSDETRLAILLALWESHDPSDTNEAVPFSELYDRVAIPDSANFAYHLNKLTDHFVEKTGDGYRLRNAGLVFVRTVIAGTGLEEATISASELDMSCTRCGDAPMEISYRNGAVYLACLTCKGFTTTEDYPYGTIAVFGFDPAGLAGRSPTELLAASAIRSRNNLRMMMEGVCPSCSGTVDDSLRLCEQHDSKAGDVCPNCGTLDSARVRYICTVCKRKSSRPIEFTVVEHPAVIAFYYHHDVDIRRDIDDIGEFIRGAERLWAIEHTVVSTDPVRIRITVPCEGDELRLVLDENLNIDDRSESY